MRTTLDIDDDILAAAKDLAKVEGKTMGQVISDLARKGLTTPRGFAEAQTGYIVDDWPTFPRQGGPEAAGVVTTELIRQIEDELDLEDMVPYDHDRGAARDFEDEPREKPRKR